jgi:hypothetical protein
MRLAITLAFGIAIVPAWFAWLGDDAFGIITLFSAAVGLPAIFRELIRTGIIRELAAAYNSNDDAHFRATFNATLMISSGCSVLTMISFGIMVAIVPLFNVPPDLVVPVQWMVAAQGVYLALFAMLMPIFNMYVVSERFMAYNNWLVMERGSQLASVLILGWVVNVGNRGHGVIAFGALSSGLNVMTLLTACAIMISLDRRLLPAPRLATREAAKSVLHTFGWNSCVQVALTLHERLPHVIMNLAFGAMGNVVFGVALRYSSYIRMATVGMTFGLDAVSARIGSSNDAVAVRTLVRHACRMQAMISLGAGVLTFTLCRPMLWVWVGSKLDDPANLEPMVRIAQVMIIAITARALSDVWITMLYGLGYVRKYAPYVMAGGVLSPILAVVLLFVMPGKSALLAPAIAFGAIMIVVHMVVVQRLGARLLGLGFWDVVAPLGRPVLCAGLASGVLLGSLALVRAWDVPTLLGVVALYGSLYAGLCWLIVLEAPDRALVIRAIRRVIGRPAPGKPVPAGALTGQSDPRD